MHVHSVIDVATRGVSVAWTTQAPQLVFTEKVTRDRIERFLRVLEVSCGSHRQDHVRLRRTAPAWGSRGDPHSAPITELLRLGKEVRVRDRGAVPRSSYVPPRCRTAAGCAQPPRVRQPGCEGITGGMCRRALARTTVQIGPSRCLARAPWRPHAPPEGRGSKGDAWTAPGQGPFSGPREPVRLPDARTRTTLPMNLLPLPRSQLSTAGRVVHTAGGLARRRRRSGLRRR